MSTQADSNWQQVRSYLKAIPLDLVCIGGFILVLASIGSPIEASPLWRFVAGGLLLVFVPGYALLAVIFPASGPESRVNKITNLEAVNVADGIMFRERLPLSFGVSVTLIPVFALVLGAVGAPFTSPIIAGTLSLFTGSCVLIGLFRRLRLPVEDRFSLPLGRWATDTRTFLFGGSWLDTVINTMLVLSILIGVSAAAFAFSVPQSDAEFTSFALLTRTSDGEYVSSQYPTNFTQGEPQELVVSITNNQRDETDYTVVAELQRVRTNSDKRLQVLSRAEQRRFSVELEPNETWRRPHDITPERAGTNLRLVYLLYQGDPPTEPSAGSADQTLQLWINVSTPPTRNNTTATGPAGNENNTSATPASSDRRSQVRTAVQAQSPAG